MAWVKVSNKNLENIKIHFSPLKNHQSIIENGILLPLNARKLESHTSPYQEFNTTASWHIPSKEKDEFTYFGKLKTQTFKCWFNDETFLDNNVGYTLKDNNHFYDFGDRYGLGRYRVDHDIPSGEIKYIICVVSEIPSEKGVFDHIVKLTGDNEIELYAWSG